jgi:hypothetical protein
VGCGLADALREARTKSSAVAAAGRATETEVGGCGLDGYSGGGASRTLRVVGERASVRPCGAAVRVGTDESSHGVGGAYAS